MRNTYSHRFNVQLRDGIHWMTGYEVVQRFGRDAFDSERVEHSEFCHCHGPRNVVPEADPFYVPGPVEVVF